MDLKSQETLYNHLYADFHYSNFLECDYYSYYIGTMCCILCEY